MTSRVITDPLVAYAARLHAAIGSGHHVASPLGAWMVLALLARADDSDGQSAAAEQLAVALGTDLDTAASMTDQLLASPHPALRSAAVAWLEPTCETARMRAYLDALPIENAPMPTQEEADAWASDHTDGMVKEFPIDLERVTALFTLATALVTKVVWLTPLTEVPAAHLGPGPFADLLTRALQAHASAHHRLTISDSAVGPVAVHEAMADGLRVVSVSADPAHSPADVLAAAHEIALEGARPTDLHALPVGRGHSWLISESRGPVKDPSGREARIPHATLPAWSASSSHDLVQLGSNLGFTAAGTMLRALLDTAAVDVAAQTAVARFHAKGFEAAAVTAYAAARTGAPRLAPEGIIRTVVLRFGHPYAVVAVATAPDGTDHAWDGIPAFSAWVEQPEEPA